MYGQNLGGRPDAPGEPIFAKFCMRVRVPDLFLCFEFQKDRVKNVGAVVVELSPLPLTRHIAYTTACCYRTSRDSERLERLAITFHKVSLDEHSIWPYFSRHKYFNGLL